MRKYKCKEITVLVKNKNFTKVVGELKRLEKLCIKVHWINANHYSKKEVKG